MVVGDQYHGVMSHDGSSRSKPAGANSTWKSGLLSEEGVYGVILVSGIIVATNVASDSSWHVFTVVISTVIVFWAAHVYAGTVAQHGHDDDEGSLRVAFREALGDRTGCWWLSFPHRSCCCWARSGRSTTTSRSGSRSGSTSPCSRCSDSSRSRAGVAGLFGRLGGALLTAAFGVVVILLKAFIH